MIAIKEVLEADIVIEGGGIAGLMCAISAANNGAKVIILEKANTKRSGAGAGGNDHFACYIPELHGDNLAKVKTEFFNSLVGPDHDMDLVDTLLLNTFPIIQKWHEWGINMKPKGDWKCEGHAFPGRMKVWLKYDGSNQKEVLTKQAIKAGVKIINHSPVLELIKNKDGSFGACLALDVSNQEPAFRIVKAKAIMLASGGACRLFLSANTPGSLFNVSVCPANTGESMAQFFRVGGRLLGMDRGYRHAGTKYASRSGKATWIGVYRYPNGDAIGPYTDEPNREYGDITGDIWNTAFSDLMANGRGPTIMDCGGASKEDIDYMLWAMKCEGLTGQINQMQAEGIDPMKHGIVFGQYEPQGFRGIEINAKAETNIKGIYAAGDHIGNLRANISSAAVFGWIGGENAVEYSKTVNIDADIENNAYLQEKMAYYSQFYARKSGANWQECNHALQQILSDFAAPGPYKVRSESLLNAGIKFLGDLRKRVDKEMFVSNSHELMRAAESLALLEIGQILSYSALERKESRGNLVRSDYTFTNPLLNNMFLQIWQDNNEIKTTWRAKR